MLAVVVDLGWPWWVTTMIALAVATAAGAAFFVTRRPPARGVLATLAVQGVVLAAVAPLVMDTAGNTATVMGESSSEAKTLVLDVQPEASKFNFTDSQGNKKWTSATTSSSKDRSSKKGRRRTSERGSAPGSSSRR